LVKEGRVLGFEFYAFSREGRFHFGIKQDARSLLADRDGGYW
jgi:hypothetical protein